MRLRRIDNGTLISFQAHETDPLSAERYLDSYVTRVLGGLRAPPPAEAPR